MPLVNHRYDIVQILDQPFLARPYAGLRRRTKSAQIKGVSDNSLGRPPRTRWLEGIQVIIEAVHADNHGTWLSIVVGRPPNANRERCPIRNLNGAAVRPSPKT